MFSRVTILVGVTVRSCLEACCYYSITTQYVVTVYEYAFVWCAVVWWWCGCWCYGDKRPPYHRRLIVAAWTSTVVVAQRFVQLVRRHVLCYSVLFSPLGLGAITVRAGMTVVVVSCNINSSIVYCKYVNIDPG